MSESLEELKAIRDGAPKGATHSNDVGEYGMYSNGDYFSRWTPSNMKPTTNCNWRSLSDINRIIELTERNT